MSDEHAARAQTLALLITELRQLEGQLPSSLAAGRHDATCDEWCKVWMLLVGAWYSLGWSSHSTQSGPLEEELPAAHRFANSIGPSLPTVLAASHLNAWHAGYFLVSAEHRIADALHRSCKIFLGNKYFDAYIDKCCKAILAGCPRCGDSTEYFASSRIVLSSFLKRREHPQATDLGAVFDRVNVLKHGPTGDPVDSLRIDRRWQQACRAMGSAISVLGDLSSHWNSDIIRGGAV